MTFSYRRESASDQPGVVLAAPRADSLEIAVPEWVGSSRFAIHFPAHLGSG
ncbi:hypothetical protein [Natrinema ejinorense]|uniref:hypothetical protein n=1 Tax=Natrinema ejinorense TaxID=373386 RepID=UPI00147493AC|nr:hypothetical protein [Natrinema ejinorense]